MEEDIKELVENYWVRFVEVKYRKYQALGVWRWEIRTCSSVAGGSTFAEALKGTRLVLMQRLRGV